MTTRISIALFIFVLVMSPPTLIFADTLEIEVDTVTVMSGPGEKYKQIREVFIGEKYRIIREKKDWYKVILEDGKQGWVSECAGSVVRENLTKGSIESLSWAKETIKRADRLVNIASIAVAVFAALGTLLAVIVGIFGTKWFRDHRRLVKSHKRMDEVFERAAEDAQSVTGEIKLPVFAIDLLDDDKKKSIKKEIEKIERNGSSIDEIDQRVFTLQFFADIKPKVFILLGHYYRYKENWGKALLRYNFAIEIDEKFSAGYYNMSLCYLNLGKNIEGLKCAEQSIEISKRNRESYFEPYYVKGALLDNLERFKEAIENYDIAYNLSEKKYYWCVYNKACSLVRWGDKEQDEENKKEKFLLALKELNKIKQIDVVIKQAMKDPDLEPLKQHPELSAEYKRMENQG